MLDLRPHGSSLGLEGIRVQAEARRAGDTLVLIFVLSGVLERVQLPPPAPARMVDGLWRRTCFEAFVGRDGAAAYQELNLAPSGAWAVHAFHTYRQGGVVNDEAVAPDVRVQRYPGAIRLDAEVSLVRLDAAHARAPVRIGLSAVVEHAGGARSYWALAHAPGAPDFHRSEAWRLRLAAPSGACDGEPS